MRYSEDTIFVNEAVASETTVSEAVDITYIVGYAVYASWTGTTIAGSIKLQASVDNVSWSDVADSSVTISGASNSFWNITDAFYRYFRLSVTADDENVITVNAAFFAKGG